MLHKSSIDTGVMEYFLGLVLHDTEAPRSVAKTRQQGNHEVTQNLHQLPERALAASSLSLLLAGPSTLPALLATLTPVVPQGIPGGVTLSVYVMLWVNDAWKLMEEVSLFIFSRV